MGAPGASISCLLTTDFDRYRGNRRVLLQIRLTAALVNVEKLLTNGIVQPGALGA